MKDSMLPPVGLMVLLRLQVGLSLNCTPKIGITQIKSSTEYHLKQTETCWHTHIVPKGKPLDSHIVGYKCLIHPDTPTNI